MPSSRSGWLPTICDHTAPRSVFLGSNAGMSAGDGRTIEPRIRISRHDGGRARWSGSRARVQPRNFCQRVPPSTTSSTSNVISLQPKRTARFALWRWTHGGPPSQQPEKPRTVDALRSPPWQCDNAVRRHPAADRSCGLRRSRQRRNWFRCPALGQKPRKICVLMTETWASLARDREPARPGTYLHATAGSQRHFSLAKVLQSTQRQLRETVIWRVPD